MASRYRTIHCAIWNDDKFPFMSDDAKLVWLHLLTTPMSTPYGCFKAGMAALAEEMRWDVERYSKGFRECFREGFLEYDERHRVCFLKAFFKYNPPSNPNVLKSYQTTFEELPDCPPKKHALIALKAWIHGASKGFQEAFRAAFGKELERVCQIKEQEQEQEQEQENTFVRAEAQTSARGESERDQPELFEEQDATPTDQPNGDCTEPEKHHSETAAKIPPCPHLAIIDAYHRILPECPGVLVDLWPNTPRAKNLQARWRESPKHQSVEFWEWYFTEVRTLRKGFYIDPSEGGPWVANLEWLVNRSNFVKLVEQIAQRGRAA